MRYVLDKPCDECLFCPRRIVSGSRAAQIVKKIQAEDTDFLCHKGTIEGTTVVCRNSYDRMPGRLSRMAEEFGLLKFVSQEEIPGLPKAVISDDEDDEFFEDED